MKQEENYWTLVSIDAWREAEGGWTWNDVYRIKEDVYLSPDVVNNPRKLLRFLRNEGYLSSWSAGNVEVEDDGHTVEIRLRGTHEPFLALQAQWY